MLAAAKILPVARIVKSFGDDGRVIIRLSSDTKSDIKTKEPVFIYFDGLPVPFYIENTVQKGINQIIAKFEGIDTWQESEEICGELLYIENKLNKKSAVESNVIDYTKEFIGYSIVSFDNSFTGEVSNFYDYANNPCLGVKILKEEKLLPLVDEFIISINTLKREIIVSIPKGLFDL